MRATLKLHSANALCKIGFFVREQQTKKPS